MKLYTTLPKGLIPYYETELKLYKKELVQGNLQKAWKHLERAHILGQQYPLAHSEVHWRMLLFGIKIKNSKEIFGQIPRLLVGGVKSFVGRVPIGNPGGANVPPLQSFAVEQELKDILTKAGIA